MPIKFIAEINPTSERCAEVAALIPTNPFFTPEYVDAQQRLGRQAWLLSLRESDRILAGCTAFSKIGLLNKSLEIPSLPILDGTESVFWEGVLRVCKEEKITQLEVNTYATSKAEIPKLQGEVKRIHRMEYVIDLAGTDLWKALRKGHKSSVTSARKAGVTLRRSATAEACRAHAQLVLASRERRKARGETVPETLDIRNFEALAQSGAGEFFQAVVDDKVLSSALVLISARGAYYHSAGTSHDGINCGASNFLVHEIALAMQKQSKELFNLGGTVQSAMQLGSFKSGFGARRVDLEAVECYLGSPLRKKFQTAARLFRNSPIEFLRYAIGRLEHYVVFRAHVDSILPPHEPSDLIIQKLTDDEIIQAAQTHPELQEHIDRIRRDKFNDAYGVYKGGQLAHVSWLIVPEHDHLQIYQGFKLRPDEAEITHCITLPEFRRQGLYDFAIRSLAQIAKQRGIRWIFMLTNSQNIASQLGMQHAGLVRCGKLIRWKLPYCSERQAPILRLFRFFPS